jgi:lipopolysaccharide biosynthesis glycosyltransferase
MSEGRRKWGFVDIERQAFNAGVLMLNTLRWCEAGLTELVLQVKTQPQPLPLTLI